MADNQDLTPPIPPTQEESTHEPLKKTSDSEQQLYVLKSLPEIESNNLKELQKEAYYRVVRAFIAESSSMSNTRVLILNDLRREFKFVYATHAYLSKRARHDPMVQHIRGDFALSDEEMEGDDDDDEWEEWEEGEGEEEWEEEATAIETPNISSVPGEQQAEGSTTPVDLEGMAIQSSSWGQVSPESLIGRWFRMKLPGISDSIPFYIQEYDEKEGMHRTRSIMDPNDPFNWVDLRHLPRDNIKWHEECPGLPIRAYSLKPGETLLRTTSTTLNKKQLKEFGKTATGIPIIRRLDKGKSIVI